MKSEGMLKQLAIVFGIAFLVYVVAYTGIEHRRTRQGPWRVAFTNSASGEPLIRIDQPALSISNVVIAFPGASLPTNCTPGIVALEQPRPVPWEAPFGQCVFMDAMTLPGTIVFQLFGHEIQLLPRVLTIDKRERPWKSDETIRLPASPAPAGKASRADQHS